MQFQRLALEDAAAWDAIVRSFPHWDVYYLSAYARAFSIHGDGVPQLLLFQEGKTRLCFVVMQKDIADDPRFSDTLPQHTWYDWETPYGYGGPLLDGAVNDQMEAAIATQLQMYCCEHHIVSLFVRFHPLLRNFDVLSHMIEHRYMHDTIAIDTTSRDAIAQNMLSVARNRVRKGRKNGITVEIHPIEDAVPFQKMYWETMQRDSAADYYFFEDPYFHAQTQLKDNACFFYAFHENVAVAGILAYYTKEFLHYHLAASLSEYRTLAAVDFLMYETACWGADHGIRRFHLGGGMAEDDPLFRFKKKFNRSGRLPFYVGRTIFDAEAYQKLLAIRKERDASFDEHNAFMIQYRK